MHGFTVGGAEGYCVSEMVSSIWEVPGLDSDNSDAPAFLNAAELEMGEPNMVTIPDDSETRHQAPGAQSTTDRTDLFDDAIYRVTMILRAGG